MIKYFMSLLLWITVMTLGAQEKIDIDSLALYFSDLEPIEGTNTYCSTVTMDKANYLLSFQFSMQYDHSVLDYTSCQEQEDFPSFRCSDIVESNDSTLITSWIDSDQIPNEYSDELPLFTLCFESVTGSCPDPSSMLAQISREPVVIEILFGDPNDLSMTLLASEVDVTPMAFEGCDVVSSSDDIQIDAQLALSPNPASNTLNWQLDQTEQIESMSIIHQSGRVVQRFSKVENSLNIEQLNPGIYYLELRNRTGRLRHAKFVKI